MQHKSTHIISENSISRLAYVKIETNDTEIEKLKKALELISIYKNLVQGVVQKETGYYPSDSDWHSFEFEIKGNEITVTIKDGMCG